MNKSVIIAPPSVTAGKLEDKLYADEDHTKSPLLVFDLSSAVYIDLAALFVIISITQARSASGLPTRLSLPTSKTARDFLIAWRFPEAICKATGHDIADHLSSDSLHYNLASQSTYHDYGDTIQKLQWDPDWSPGSRTQRNFFEILTFRDTANSESPYSPITDETPIQECKRWKGPLIESVLNKHFADTSLKSAISTVLIYESISNSVRHPNASIIQTAAKFEGDPPSSKASPINHPMHKYNTLRICIWDDGDSIPSTLIPLLEAGKNIRNTQLPHWFGDTIYYKHKDFNSPDIAAEGAIEEATDVNTHPPKEGRMLLFSLLAGVSRSHGESPVQNIPSQQSEAQSATQSLFERGYGLYALRRSIVNHFQGTLAIRSANHFLLAKPAHDAIRKKWRAQCHVEIVTYPPERYSPFKGNLLTITLPIPSASK